MDYSLLKNKATLILGNNLSGKSKISKEINSYFYNSQIISIKNHSLFLFRKVYDELFLIKKESNPLFDSLIKRSGFSKNYNSKTTHLSGGEKQLLQLFLSIKYDNNTFIFDDNLEMVSKRYKEIIYSTLKEHNKTIIVTDVKLPTYYKLFDKFYILRKEELIDINGIENSLEDNLLESNHIYRER
ncbi:MAG: hypothetical protein CR982_00135 [Candidatus Cloacimonadota bacterium]|nr:MAG: hypothetical protein CR982_00135 [Candidatus Cloacimonadota bacterium]PIE79114.1 MAG: hypothetical protein CSA15_04380 [Candidatus Delongbacteria bacterium]